MRSLFVALLYLPTAWCPAQDDPQPLGLSEIAPLVVTLRKGEWDVKKASNVIQGLMHNGQLAAAGWWIEGALGAVRKKALPSAAQRNLLALRKDLTTRSKKDGAKAFKLAVTLARQADAATSRKNFAEADRAALAATQHLVVFPNPAAQKILDRVRKKLSKQPHENQNARSLPKQRKKTDDLRAASEKMLRPRLDATVDAYTRFGCLAAYSGLRALVTALQPDETSTETLARLRKVTLAFRKPESLRIRVICFHSVDVYLDGQKIGTQRGEIAQMLRDEEGAARKAIDVPILPGDQVVLKLTLGEMPPIPIAGPLKMLSIHTSLGGEALPAQCYLAARLGDSDRVGNAELVPVVVGKRIPAPEGISAGPPNAPPAEFAADFSESFDGADVNWIMPIQTSTDEWFETAGVKPTYIFVSFRDPSYVIRVPVE